jgi:DNA-binding transcriptional ArsR family regulator
MEEEKIVLDKKTFKALAVDTRVDLMKELSKRRKTQSELAESLGLSVATVKEHLDKMQEAGLLKQKDEGRKWKYYDLTEKGRCVLHPERKKIWIVLVSLFFVAGFAIFTTFGSLISFGNYQPYMMRSVAQNSNKGMMESADVAFAEDAEMADDNIVAAKTFQPEAYDGSASREVKMPVLQYISYGMLLLLIFLFIYYMSDYNSKKN